MTTSQSPLAEPSSPPIISISRSRPNHSTKLSDEEKEKLCLARSDVKEGKMTMYKAALIHKVSLSTLWKWCQRDDDEEIPTVGRPCYLGAQLENKIKDWLFEAARSCKCCD